jgi:hypothetical protein
MSTDDEKIEHINKILDCIEQYVISLVKVANGSNVAPVPEEKLMAVVQANRAKLIQLFKDAGQLV